MFLRHFISIFTLANLLNLKMPPPRNELWPEPLKNLGRVYQKATLSSHDAAAAAKIVTAQRFQRPKRILLLPPRPKTETRSSSNYMRSLPTTTYFTTERVDDRRNENHLHRLEEEGEKGNEDDYG